MPSQNSLQPQEIPKHLLAVRGQDRLGVELNAVDRGVTMLYGHHFAVVRDGGYLATCSCSHIMTQELFTEVIGQAAKAVHKRLRQVEFRTQACDHPILWAADESYYLKFFIFQVCEEK